MRKQKLVAIGAALMLSMAGLTVGAVAMAEEPDCDNFPEAEGCVVAAPCDDDPTAEGCSPVVDPCDADPTGEGCSPVVDPCDADPNAEGCDGGQTEECTMGVDCPGDRPVTWNDADKDVAANVLATPGTRTNASGVKIPSNAHSADLPGLYFRWDPQQKNDGYLKVCPPMFDNYSSFTFTAKESNKYWDYSIAPQPDQEMTADGCYVFFIPIRDKNINMTFVVDIETKCPEGQILVDGECMVEQDCEEGEVLIDDECVPVEPACDPAEDPNGCCPEGSTFIDGVCEPPCDPETDEFGCETPFITCPDGSMPVDGECEVPEPECEEGQLLIDDECVDPEPMEIDRPVVKPPAPKPLEVPVVVPPKAKELAFTGVDYSLYSALALSLGLMGLGLAVRRSSRLAGPRHRS